MGFESAGPRKVPAAVARAIRARFRNRPKTGRNPADYQKMLTNSGAYRKVHMIPSEAMSTLSAPAMSKRSYSARSVKLQTRNWAPAP
jgi:hypothetical protein